MTTVTLPPRHLWVLAGETAWVRGVAATVTATLTGEWCWIGEGDGEIAPDRACSLLGGEWPGVVYDARAGFDPDAFGAVAGTIRAGGLLLLLTPPLDEWPDYPDPQRERIAVYPYSAEQVSSRYLHRLVRVLQESEGCQIIEQGHPLPPLPDIFPGALSPERGECATADQRAAVDALCRVARGHRNRPLVLISDRGRGKSAALGLAAARLLKDGLSRIIITAPRRSAVDQVFLHAIRQLPGAELHFEPPDRLVHENIHCDMLLVDEAAALPISLLEPLLRKYSRIAFATTVHGYEGSGRGFELRFRKILDEVTPGWRRLRMSEPVRWAEGDPLERLVFRALILDAEPVADETLNHISTTAYRIETIDRDRLADDEALLSQIFALLVLAHYRTSPMDLLNLLDGPNIEITLLKHDKMVVGCAMVAREGGIETELAGQIAAGERRLRGNLMPQSLLNHEALLGAAELQAARVMRIVIHPALQGQGLGRQLITALVERAEKGGVDYFGASFGAEPQLLDFWQRVGCFPIRAGLKREASSGAHAVMVMRPLSRAGDELFTQARRRFTRQLPVLLTEPLSQLESELVVRLLLSCDIPVPDDESWQDASAFANTHRDYGNCLLGVSEVVLFALSRGEMGMTKLQHSMLVSKVLQRRPWHELASLLSLAGRREAMGLLRGLVGDICYFYELRQSAGQNYEHEV
ncbi:MAG: GNAT family N-acetyltransferase [Chromatiales bacterium]|nr:GNAT family N-acetyltransferase [Chromatiales bacterium]